MFAPNGNPLLSNSEGHRKVNETQAPLHFSRAPCSAAINNYPPLIARILPLFLLLLHTFSLSLWMVSACPRQISTKEGKNCPGSSDLRLSLILRPPSFLSADRQTQVAVKEQPDFDTRFRFETDGPWVKRSPRFLVPFAGFMSVSSSMRPTGGKTGLIVERKHVWKAFLCSFTRAFWQIGSWWLERIRQLLLGGRSVIFKILGIDLINVWFLTINRGSIGDAGTTMSGYFGRKRYWNYCCCEWNRNWNLQFHLVGEMCVKCMINRSNLMLTLGNMLNINDHERNER